MNIVSFSGGKDSTAMLIEMIAREYKIDRIIFADTKFEFPEMHEYIAKIEEYIGRPIERLQTDQVFDDWFYGKPKRGNHEGKMRGFPLTAYPCYWSREAKFKVLDKECNSHTRFIGIAADEPNRYHPQEGYEYPLVDWGWTEAKCSSYLRDLNLENPLYTKFGRLGCWWCPKQGNASLKSLYDNYPDLWKKLREMEKSDIKSFKEGVDLQDLEDAFYEDLKQMELF